MLKPLIATNMIGLVLMQMLGAAAAQTISFYYQGNTMLSANSLLVGQDRIAGEKGIVLGDGKNTTMKLNAQAHLDQDADYHPYGYDHANALTFGYNGEYQDPTTRFVYLRTRDYDPVHMRFMSMDSYPLLNRYQFANQDPINHIDPSGHAALGMIFGLGFFGGGIYAAIDGGRHHRWLEMAGGIVGALVGASIFSYNFPRSKVIEPDEEDTEHNGLVDIDAMHGLRAHMDMAEEKEVPHFESRGESRSVYLQYVKGLLDDPNLSERYDPGVKFLTYPDELASYDGSSVSNVPSGNQGRVGIEFLQTRDRLDILHDSKQLTRFIKVQGAIRDIASTETVLQQFDPSDNPVIQALRDHQIWIGVKAPDNYIPAPVNDPALEDDVRDLILQCVFS